MNNGLPMKLNFSQMFLYVRRNLCLALSLLILPVLLAILPGCVAPNNGDPLDPPSPNDNLTNSVARLHVGDSVIITFDGPATLPPHEEIIKEDGNITLSDIGHVKASGRTTGELQDAIVVKYVPEYYKRLTVTVKTGDRVFFVRGDVKGPGRQIYTGPITLTKAITAAGDFTDFSNRRNVVLTRASGKRFIVNCEKILNGVSPDPGVYPGDQIEVKKRGF